MKGLSTLAGSVLALTCLAAPAAAQMGYFGQNKVQYQTFKFKVLKTQHFDIYYYDEEAGGARMARGGSIMHLNRTHRWNWGVAFDQTPYVLAAVGAGIDTSTGQPVLVQQEQRVIQTDRGFSGILAYPFSRADRVEFNGGLRQITGKQDVTTDTFDYNSGIQLSHNV